MKLIRQFDTFSFPTDDALTPHAGVTLAKPSPTAAEREAEARVERERLARLRVDLLSRTDLGRRVLAASK